MKLRLSQIIGMSVNDIKRNIDKEMIPILDILNSKGYNTLACCQGHSENVKFEDRIYLYILFNNIYNFNNYPLFIKRKGNKKYGGIVQPRKYSNCQKTSIHFATSRKKDNNIKEQERKELLNMIKDWANSLPTLED